MLILEPEVEDVAHQNDCCGILLDLFEPTNDLILSFPAGSLIGNPQMKVAGKIDFLSGLKCLEIRIDLSLPDCAQSLFNEAFSGSNYSQSPASGFGKINGVPDSAQA